MEQERWFDRKFHFNGDQHTFPSLLERLEGTPVRLKQKVHAISVARLTNKDHDKWSVQEHVGHLIDLEPLWYGRLEDILNGEEYLRPTDLENKATDEAGHNDQEIEKLLDRFVAVRGQTMNRLRELSDRDIAKFALHPRLETPMRVMDLFFFVAEHDDHHLATIHTLIEQTREVKF